MANLKIYTNKASITRRLKEAGIKITGKPTQDNICVLIELDDHILSVDITRKFLEEKAAELLKFGVGKPQLQKIELIVREVAAERDFLKRLYQNTCGKSWTDLKVKPTRWNTTSALSDWEGVDMATCRTTVGRAVVLAKRVVGLSLRNHYLHGNYEKGAYGNIPDDIEVLTCLKTLGLNYNFLERSLPATLGNLRNLKVLRLEFNHIMKGLPKLDHLDSLEELYLDHNHLEGGINELTKLKKLKKCYIYHNKFSGMVPEELADKKDLEEFRCYNNFLQYGKKVQARIKSDPGWEG